MITIQNQVKREKEKILGKILLPKLICSFNHFFVCLCNESKNREKCFIRKVI